MTESRYCAGCDRMVGMGVHHCPGTARGNMAAANPKDAEIARLTAELAECNRLRVAENRINSELIERGRKRGIFEK